MEAIRCLAKCIKSYRCLKCLKVSSVETLGPSVGSRRFHISNKLLLSISPQEKQIPNNTHAGKLMLCISLGFLDIFKSKELDPESELIMTLKRSILLIQARRILLFFHQCGILTSVHNYFSPSACLLFRTRFCCLSITLTSILVNIASQLTG